MRKARIVLLEAALVAALGLVFALGANALSARGLRLSRNYFPGAVESVHPTPTNVNSSTNAPGKSNPLEEALRRLQQHGLQVVSSNQVVEMVHDQQYEQGLMLLIDARDDSHYQAGHIPGAWQFDHYHAEQYLPSVLPACMSAQKVVVYCNGGACEDSEFAAIMLREAGVPRDSLFVYAGGISEWMSSGQLVETGARRSGALSRPKLQ